jgi:SAM-dependent methyltransferase
VKILHLGCGRKKLDGPELLQMVGLRLEADALSVTHLDADPALEPDLVCRLGEERIPLEDDSVDLVIAFHVIEHIGHQGEARAWFAFWEDLYRVLKPGGWIYGETPYYTSIWAWSDPTHVRAMSEHSFVFFCQDSYRIPHSAISPYRIAADFKFLGMPGMPKGFIVGGDPHDPRVQNLRFALRAQKPLRPWWQDVHAGRDMADGPDRTVERHG